MPSYVVRFRSVRLFALFLLGSLSSGCTSLSEYVTNGFKVGPNYRRPPALVEPQWIDAVDVRVRSETDDLSQWWKVFNDPVLDDLICHAYRQNLTLREAGFRVLEERAQFGASIGGIFPQTQNVTGGYTRTAISLGALGGGQFGTVFSGSGAPAIRRYFGQNTTNFNLAWELDFWGRFRRTIEAAGAELDASVEDYDDVLVTLLGSIATNYIQLRIEQQQIELLKENIQLQLKTVEIANARFVLGKTTELDLAQAKTTLAQTQAQIPQKQIAIRLVANRLCVLMGMPPEELETRLGNLPLPTPPKEVAAGIPNDLLRRRPDVRRAERLAAAESARIGVAQAMLYPHISINGSFGYQSPKLNKLFTPLGFQGTYGPSFSWDVLNYGRLLNNVKFQKAKFQEVVTAYQNKVLNAAEEVENGMVLFLKAQEEVKYLTESVTQAKKAALIGEAELTVGKVDFNRVAVLQLNLVAQNNLLTQARGDVALGLIQVYRALGGGWQIRNTGCPEPSELLPPMEAPPPDAAPRMLPAAASAQLGPPTDR